MEGNIVKQMCNGVENASVIVVFITQRYIDKVDSDNSNDNCQLEFGHAMNQKSARLMIPVVMETRCFNSRGWRGPVGMALGSALFIDYTSDDKLDDVLRALVAAVQRLAPLLKDVEGSGVGVSSSATAAAHQAATKPLTSLTVDEVANLFATLHIPADAIAAVRHKQVDGELLNCVTTEDELTEAINLSSLPRVKAKLVVSKLAGYKENGVPLASIAGGSAASAPPPPASRGAARSLNFSSDRYEELTGHEGNIPAVVHVMPNGRHFASGSSDDQTVKIWDTIIAAF